MFNNFSSSKKWISYQIKFNLHAYPLTVNMRTYTTTEYFKSTGGEPKYLVGEMNIAIYERESWQHHSGTLAQLIDVHWEGGNNLAEMFQKWNQPLKLLLFEPSLTSCRAVQVHTLCMLQNQLARKRLGGRLDFFGVLANYILGHHWPYLISFIGQLLHATRVLKSRLIEKNTQKFCFSQIVGNCKTIPKM